MIGIEFKNLSFSYSHHLLFSDVTTTFKPGEKIQVTGDNGAGKTTLLKLASSLLKPQSGSVRFSANNAELNTQKFRKFMGVVLDDSHLLRHFSVIENLRLYQKMYMGSYDIQKIDSWLVRFGLESYKDTSIQYLSQGEQKKVSLIKALLHQPNVIILDEPTNSLDTAAKQILTEIFSTLSSDVLLLVSTHDHGWASEWANRNIEIKAGKIQ